MSINHFLYQFFISFAAGALTLSLNPVQTINTDLFCLTASNGTGVIGPALAHLSNESHRDVASHFSRNLGKGFVSTGSAEAGGFLNGLFRSGGPFRNIIRFLVNAWRSHSPALINRGSELARDVIQRGSQRLVNRLERHLDGSESTTSQPHSDSAHTATEDGSGFFW